MEVAGQGPDTEREQVTRILQSAAFRNAESQRRLFAYLAEKSLSGESEQLKEYTVGLEVFGKSEGYDPQHDASVRIQAGKLRQKLEDYYRTEGAGDTVQIVFPKGRFRLTFERRQPTGLPPLPDSQPTPRRTWRFLVLAALVATAGFVLWWPLRARRDGVRTEPGWTSALEEVWRPFLSSRRPLLISLGAPLFVRHGDAFVRDPRVNEPSQIDSSLVMNELRRAFPEASATPAHIYTGIGEAKGAFELARLLGASRRDLLIKGSSALSWEDIAGNEIVFLGSPKYNPQLKDLPVARTLAMSPGEIHNLRPKTGEPAVLHGNWPPGSPYLIEDYAVVSRLAGLHGQGVVMLLAASSTEGTLAAVQYVTQPAHAADMVRRLRQPDGALPRHFEVVIRARFKAMVPVEVTYQFHHVLD